MFIICSEHPEIDNPERHKNFLAAGLILLYCIAYAVLRLLVSPSMEVDEAEQFLAATVFSFGYDQQEPLYSWIVKAVSFLFGMNIMTLTVVKYSLLFLFYFFFFLIARNFWDWKKSLLITASLLIFHTFSYEVHRDLTHTILVSVMAVITCYLYIRTEREAKAGYYLLTGVSIGLGILSKYNFIFFLLALLLSSMSCREGRRVVFDRRIFLSMLSSILVLLPHFVWLVKKNFVSIYYAFEKSRAGELASNTPLGILSLVFFTYLNALLYCIVSGVFFWRYFSRDETRDKHLSRVFQLLAFYGFVMPLFAIFLLRTGSFPSRWLAPVVFTLPLAVFSFVRMDMRKNEFRLFGYLCILIAVAVLAVRTFIGFFPDTVGKVERIHIPYKVLSQRLTEKLKDAGFDDFQDLAIIADGDNKHNRCVAANIMACIPGAKFVPLRNFMNESLTKKRVLDKGGIFVHDISKRQIIMTPEKFISTFPSELPIVDFKSPYLHSSKSPPYVLRVVIIPPSIPPSEADQRPGM